MGLFRTLFFLVLVYFIAKVFARLIAPLFAGYYDKDTAANKKSTGNKQRVNNITIDTSKAKSNLQSKPNIDRIDAEDVDFEEVE